MPPARAPSASTAPTQDCGQQRGGAVGLARGVAAELVRPDDGARGGGEGSEWERSDQPGVAPFPSDKASKLEALRDNQDLTAEWACRVLVS